MFKLSFMVEDKNLAAALRAVAGLAVNMEPPQPVVNAQLTKTKKVVPMSGGDVLSIVADKLPLDNAFTSLDVSKVLTELGRVSSLTNARNYLQRGVERGLFAKAGDKGWYHRVINKETV